MFPCHARGLRYGLSGPGLRKNYQNRHGQNNHAAPFGMCSIGQVFFWIPACAGMTRFVVRGGHARVTKGRPYIETERWQTFLLSPAISVFRHSCAGRNPEPMIEGKQTAVIFSPRWTESTTPKAVVQKTAHSCEHSCLRSGSWVMGKARVGKSPALSSRLLEYKAFQISRV